MEGQGSCNSWIVLFQNGKPLFQRCNAALPYTAARPLDGIELDGLRMEVEEPLRKARIRFTSRELDLDLLWEGLQPLQDSIALSADEDGAFSEDIAHAHLEGTCRVTGQVRLRDGTIVLFDGKGGRDIAAGPRDWGALAHYRIVFPIFDDGLTLIGIHGIADGGRHAYMKMLHDGARWNRIARLEDELTFEPDDMTVRATRWSAELEDGRRWSVEGRTLFRAFIPHDGFMLAEHMAEFTRDDGAKGYGLIECGYRFPWSGNGNAG
ncbi:hypothetical protein SAMN02927924_02865 [Sphingobium faniae]|nr:hypothetical protein SAMN02927924_02865 [Sphingobium faniae]